MGYILYIRCFFGVRPRTKKCRGWGGILLDIPRKNTVYTIYIPFWGLICIGRWRKLTSLRGYLFSCCTKIQIIYNIGYPFGSTWIVQQVTSLGNLINHGKIISANIWTSVIIYSCIFYYTFCIWGLSEIHFTQFMN